MQGRSARPVQALEYVTVADVADIPPGQLRLVTTGSRWYALANVGGRFYALDNNCPHNGGPLAKGTLDGSVLQCPWHGWRWDVTNGKNCWPGSAWRAARLPVRITDGAIQLPVL
jgi:nitrite reductase/ring-hydroxylating ferredoxin subunit